MANYGAKDLKIELADAGDTLRDITAFVRSCNGVEIDPSIEPSHPFGSAFAKALYTGFTSYAPIVLTGIYDDAALTPDALYVRGANRRFAVTYGSTKKTSGTVLLGKYKRIPVSEKAHQYELTLQVTDTVTEA